MHPPAVNTADAVLWLYKWTYLAWTEAFAQDQDQEGKLRVNAVGKNLDS